MVGPVGEENEELSEQEDKYQAYIIGQMASENRVVATCHLTTVFDKMVRVHKASFFKTITKLPKNVDCEQSSTSICRKRSIKICEESRDQS